MKLSALFVALTVSSAAAFSASRTPLLSRSALTSTSRSRVFAAEEGSSMRTEPTEAPDAVPAPKQPAGGVQPSLPTPVDGPALDVRLLPYVLVPLLVLASQLFLTFSRDTLPAEFLGAADMTK